MGGTSASYRNVTRPCAFRGCCTCSGFRAAAQRPGLCSCCGHSIHYHAPDFAKEPSEDSDYFRGSMSEISFEIGSISTNAPSTSDSVKVCSMRVGEYVDIE